MADEIKVQNSQSDKKPVEKKKKKKVKGSGKIGKWFREMRSELKKVVWPTGKQVINNSLVAIVVIVIFSIVVWGFDQIAAQAVNALISLGG